MGRYQHSASADLAADVVFDQLADVRSLPRYFPVLRSVQPRHGEVVQVETERDRHHVDTQGWLRVDRARRRLRWGSQWPNDYSGQLDVIDRGAGACDIVVELNTTRAEGEGVRHELEQAVATLTQVVALRDDERRQATGDDER